MIQRESTSVPLTGPSQGRQRSPVPQPSHAENARPARQRVIHFSKDQIANYLVVIIMNWIGNGIISIVANCARILSEARFPCPQVTAMSNNGNHQHLPSHTFQIDCSHSTCPIFIRTGNHFETSFSVSIAIAESIEYDRVPCGKQLLPCQC